MRVRSGPYLACRSQNGSRGTVLELFEFIRDHPCDRRVHMYELYPRYVVQDRHSGPPVFVARQLIKEPGQIFLRKFPSTTMWYRVRLMKRNV